MPLIFVYGTLRKGGRYHHYLQSGRFAGAAESMKHFKVIERAPPDDPEGYPVAFEDAAGQKIVGELYEVDETVLKAVDALEDYPNEYDRRDYEFKTAHGQVTALMYTGKNNGI